MTIAVLSSRTMIAVLLLLFAASLHTAGHASIRSYYCYSVQQSSPCNKPGEIIKNPIHFPNFFSLTVIWYTLTYSDCVLAPFYVFTLHCRFVQSYPFALDCTPQNSTLLHVRTKGFRCRLTILLLNDFPFLFLIHNKGCGEPTDRTTGKVFTV